MTHIWFAQCDGIDRAAALALGVATSGVACFATFEPGSERWQFFLPADRVSEFSPLLRRLATLAAAPPEDPRDLQLAVLAFPESGTAALCLSSCLSKARFYGAVAFNPKADANAWCVMVLNDDLPRASYISDYMRNWGEEWAAWSARNQV